MIEGSGSDKVKGIYMFLAFKEILHKPLKNCQFSRARPPFCNKKAIPYQAAQREKMGSFGRSRRPVVD